jgi:hypothetical protein
MKIFIIVLVLLSTSSVFSETKTLDLEVHYPTHFCKYMENHLPLLEDQLPGLVSFVHCDVVDANSNGFFKGEVNIAVETNLKSCATKKLEIVRIAGNSLNDIREKIKVFEVLGLRILATTQADKYNYNGGQNMFVMAREICD